MNINSRHITQTLFTRLDALPAKPPIKWPQRQFHGNESELYLQPFVLRGITDLQTLSGGLSISTGVFQVNVVAPRDNGSRPAEDQADAIAAHFNADRSLDGIDILNISIPPAVTGDTTYTIPVSITYRVVGKYGTN